MSEYIIECADCGYRRETDSDAEKQRLVKTHDTPGHRPHWKKPEWN